VNSLRVRGSSLFSSSEATVLLRQVSMGRRNLVSRSCLDFSVCLDRQRRRGLQCERSYTHFQCTHTSSVLTLQTYSHALRELGVLAVSVTSGKVSSWLFSHTLHGLVILAVSVMPGVVSSRLFSHALRGLVVLGEWWLQRLSRG